MNESAATQAAVSHLPPKAARMAAIEILLADPAALGDDVLESALYILRERLLEAEQQLRNHSGTGASPRCHATSHGSHPAARRTCVQRCGPRRRSSHPRLPSGPGACT